MDDQKGVRFQSHKLVDMVASDTICLNAQYIHITTPQEINMYRSATRAAQKEADLVTKGSRKGKNPATGDADSGFTFAVAYVASVVFTGGAMAAAAPFVVGGLAALCGSAAVIATANQDIANGGNASIWDYMTNGLIGAGSGAMAGAAFMLDPYAAQGLVTMAISGAPGVVIGGTFFSSYLKV